MTTLGATIDRDRVGGVPRARITGAIDAANAAQLQSRLTAAVQNVDVGLIVDLSAVTYIDSAGVRLLFELCERLQWRGQACRLALPPAAPIRRILAITKLDTLVAIDDDAAAAAAAMTA